MDTDLIANIPLFAKLTPEQVAELASLLKSVSLPAQQPVFWIGDTGSDFYIVQVGRVALTYPDHTGSEMTLAVLGPGQFFGEISLLDGGQRTATARAVNDCLLMSLGRHDFLEFLQRHPGVAVQVITVLGQRQRETLDKLRGVRNVNLEIEEHATAWQRVADMIASISASQAFVLIHVFWFGVWMLYNALQSLRGKQGFDPPPFGLLTMVVSLEAIFLSIFVLISQNRSGEKDRIRADLDYQVNLKAQHEIMQLHQKVDRLEAAFNNAAPPVAVTLPGEPTLRDAGAAESAASTR